MPTTPQALVHYLANALTWIRLSLLLGLLLTLTLLAAGAEALVLSAADEPAFAVDSGKQDVGKPPLTDTHGDPLPRGAVMRFGTVRFQHDAEVTFGFFSADGKSLTTAGQDHTVRRWDVATGKELQRSAIHLPKEESYTHRGHRVSPDGKTLATIHTQNADNGSTFVTSICLWDLATGKHRVLEGRPKNNRMFTGMAFSPDGAILAAASADGDVRLWNVGSGALIRQISVAEGTVLLAFSPSSALLALGTDKGIVVREAATGKEVRQFPLARRAASMSFSPDDKKLATADSPIRVWDMETGKVRLEVNHDEKVSLGGGSSTINTPRDVAFSPDGKLLAVNLSGTVALLDAATGDKIRTVLADRRASSKRMFFSPDGRHLALPGQVNFHLYETATGKPLHDEGHQGSVKAVAFAPDGRTLATADPGTVRLWDAATGKEQRRWPNLARDHSTLAFAPDGKSLAHAGGATVRLWNPATGAELPQFKSLQASSVAFSPDGTLLATLSTTGPVLWNSATGKAVRQFSGENMRTDGKLVYSSDGKTLVSVGSPPGGPLGLWDVPSGKMRHKIDPSGAGALYSAAALSPDGAYVAAYGGVLRPDNRGLYLYDVGTGKQVGHFQTTDCHRCHMVLAYSPDGKTLASGDVSNDVTLWEVLTGKPRQKLAGHRRWVENLAFAPDGKRLASASADGTALVWDLSASARPAPAGADDCWRALSGEDTAAAYDAIQALIRAPGQALPLLRQHLKSVPGIEPRRLDALVANLDSNEFAARQKATDELEKLGEQAEAALRKALADRPPLETRQRIDKLLERLATIQVALPDLLQALRGVEVLEHIGTADAREILERLAQGAPKARLTQDAKAALERMAKGR